MDGRQLRPFQATSSAEISPPGRSPIVLLSVPTWGQRYSGLHGQKTRGIRPPAGQEAGPWRDTEPPATPAPGTAGVSQSMWLGRLPWTKSNLVTETLPRLMRAPGSFARLTSFGCTAQ